MLFLKETPKFSPNQRNQREAFYRELRLKLIFIIEIIIWILCLITAVLWVREPSVDYYEPITYVLGVIGLGIELTRRNTGKPKNLSYPADDVAWYEIERRFPVLIAEMKEDFANPENINVRKFFIKSSKTSVNRSEHCFEYHTDVHPDLTAAISYFEDLGLIRDITSGNCPMYILKEHFVDYLQSKNA